MVNYEDPNYNISIPVFSIHGNHDDPAGVRYLTLKVHILCKKKIIMWMNHFTSEMSL